MRTRLVFWGTNEKNEKILLGLSLNDEANTIDVTMFPGESVSEEFAEQFRQEWRQGKEILLPDPHTTLSRPLSISDSILPEGFKVDREDILKRAQTEWHFVVLSGKLYRAYHSELEDLQEQVAGLTGFDSGVWEELKTFWSKVQEQAREKNLFRDHANHIRDNTNALFEDLKKLRKQVDAEFQTASQQHLANFKEQLDGLQKKVNDGLSLNPVFKELKEIQNKFKDTKFTGSHRKQIWRQLDGLFKEVKEKKFGPESNEKQNADSRLQKRYDGLLSAIGRMEKSVGRDQQEVTYQKAKVQDADGSLESQLRGAKIGMIEERVRSKQEKLDDMIQTKAKLEKQLAKNERRRQEKKERQDIAKAKKDIEAKIASDIKSAEQEREKSGVAEAIRAVQSAAEPLVFELEDTMEDVVDTIKAVASVIEDKFGSFVAQISQEEE